MVTDECSRARIRNYSGSGEDGAPAGDQLPQCLAAKAALQVRMRHGDWAGQALLLDQRRRLGDGAITCLPSLLSQEHGIVLRIEAKG